MTNPPSGPWTPAPESPPSSAIPGWPPAEATPFAGLPPRSVVLARQFSRSIARAVTFGTVAAAVSSIAITFLAPADVPSWLVFLGAVIVGGLDGMALAIVLVPGHVRRAYEAFSWLGRSEMNRFRERTGTNVPTRVDAIRPWLSAHPVTDATRLPRVELLAFLGDLAAARAELDAAPPTDDPAEQLERAVLAQYLGWLGGEPATVEVVEQIGAGLPSESCERRMASVSIAVARARELAAAEDVGWWRPLEAVRGSLGREPIGVVVRDTWGRVLGSMLGTGGAIAVAGLLLAGRL